MVFAFPRFKPGDHVGVTSRVSTSGGTQGGGTWLPGDEGAIVDALLPTAKWKGNVPVYRVRFPGPMQADLSEDLLTPLDALPTKWPAA